MSACVVHVTSSRHDTTRMIMLWDKSHGIFALLYPINIFLSHTHTLPQHSSLYYIYTVHPSPIHTPLLVTVPHTHATLSLWLPHTHTQSLYHIHHTQSLQLPHTHSQSLYHIHTLLVTFFSCIHTLPVFPEQVWEGFHAVASLTSSFSSVMYKNERKNQYLLLAVYCKSPCKLQRCVPLCLLSELCYVMLNSILLFSITERQHKYYIQVWLISPCHAPVLYL